MGRRRFGRSLAMLVAVVLFLQFSLPAVADPVEVCTAAGEQCYPEISGQYIVWQDFRNGDWGSDIFLYDIETGAEMPITQATGFQYDARIQGDRVIWVEDNTTERVIVLYNITTQAQSRIPLDPYCSPSFLSIWGDIIAWVGGSWGSDILLYDIFYHDLRTGNTTRLTHSGNANCPDVHDGKIVWFEYRNYQRHDIFLYDTDSGTEMEITNESELQTLPSIWGDRIVWVDYRNANGYNESGESDIYMYELSTGRETRLTGEGSHYGNPVICGDTVVWNKYDFETGGLYAYNITTGEETLVHEYMDKKKVGYIEFFDLDGKNVVWSQDVDWEGSDIYMGSTSPVEGGISFLTICVTSLGVAAATVLILVYRYVRKKPGAPLPPV